MTRGKLFIIMLLVALVGTASAQRPSAADELLGEPHWPNVPLNKLPDPTINPNPPFADPNEVANRILGLSAGGGDVTGALARWPDLPAEPRPSPFGFEAGARYWYSSATMRFAFANGDPTFGNPTSTLDWQKMGTHTGEIFARIDHKPSGFFVKGLVGMGRTIDGDINDRDYLFTLATFSDTTSSINDGTLTYAMIDIGWAYNPVSDIRIGFFAGYHFWRESATAYGVRCNSVTSPVNLCGNVGDVPVGFNVPVLRYQPTWHVVRLGVEGRAAITDRWSVSGEVAAVPFAALQNKDSHLLRQDSSDLGPAPNIITDSKYAYGIEAEMFINYAITPHIEVGTGVRYWGLAAHSGSVHFGPTFASNFQLDNFDLQRLGVLVQVKGSF